VRKIPDTTKISTSNGLEPWWNAGAGQMKQAFPKRFFDILGLVSLIDLKLNKTFHFETAVYGTVRTVV